MHIFVAASKWPIKRRGTIQTFYLPRQSLLFTMSQRQISESTPLPIFTSHAYLPTDPTRNHYLFSHPMPTYQLAPLETSL